MIQRTTIRAGKPLAAVSTTCLRAWFRKSVLLGVALACSVLGRDEYSRMFDKTFTVQTASTVSIDHKFGDIAVSTHPERTVMIHAEIHASGRDREDAEQIANRTAIETDTSAGVAIRTHYPEGFHNASYYVRYQLTIPEDSPLAVRSSFGSVSVTGLRADGDIRASHGAVALRDGKGSQTIGNSFGAVEVTGNAGEVVITNTNGAVRVADCGPAVITNAFGAVLVKNAAGSVTVKSKNGSVNVSNSQGADVKMSFGAVILTGISGPVQVENQYGAVELSGLKTGECQPVRILTSYSPIRIRMNGSPNYRISARTSYSKIHTDFPLKISGSLSNDDVSGTIGNGGCEMNLNSSYGPIEILRSGS